ncbi:DNA replication/repair protein RecF [Stutzerimonas urumqiensis]|uniref:DNA replication/repair protein RecF n=1 Tax=Stutzerimonas urumqiensis TaxID=638269 RepID=UPI003BAC9068
MSLQRLDVTGVRNLHPVTLHFSPRINILYGDNGSGKTSLLEAVHMLGLARSFRSTRIQSAINHEADGCVLFGQVQLAAQEQRAIGISRHRSGDTTIRINGQNVRSAAELADCVPLQLINPDSFRLLEGAPKLRRQFLDWGVFHVEPRFLSAWHRVQQALRQRNSWLRHGRLDAVSQAAWDREVELASNELDDYRRAYISRLKPVFERTLSQLCMLDDELQLSYYRGWDKDRPLGEVLGAAVDRDRLVGYTQAGPQRADLRLRSKGHNAADVLSRGQQKLVVCALRIAQGHLVSEVKQGQCIYLVDDLPSELDGPHRQSLCRLLEQLDCQVFITCVDREPLSECWQSSTPVSMFHVEHGRVVQMHGPSE